MSWQVTARVSGGCKYSTEETEAYLHAAKALSHAADELNRTHDSFRALSFQLSTYPYASSAVALAVRIKLPTAMPQTISNCRTINSSNVATATRAHWELWRHDCLNYRP
mgnify:CR=1 FL=1